MESHDSSCEKVAPTPLVLDFGTLHDQLGPPKRRGRLLIEHDKITGVLPPGTPIDHSATVIEANCVVPGLINAHAHLEQDARADVVAAFSTTTPTQRAVIAAQQARRALEAGVTTLRDLGASHNIAIELREAIAAGVIPGPNIVAAGLVICMTGGHGAFAGRQVDGPWQVRQAVREQRAAGADCIKFIATGGVLTPGTVPAREQLTEQELAAGVEEAHRFGMHTAAHAIGTAGIASATRAGVDSIEHGHLIDADGISLMLDHRTCLIPTLSALRAIIDAPAEAGMPVAVRDKATAIAQRSAENLRRAREAGVRFVAGSDAGTPFNHHNQFGRELELMQTVLGMSPAEALRAATADAAALLGLDRGTLGPGDVADLVVLDHDIDHTAAFDNPAFVIKAGTIVHARAKGAAATKSGRLEHCRMGRAR